MHVVASMLRVIAFCLALVRLHLEYFVQSWTSQYRKDIDTTECSTTKMIRGLKHRIYDEWLREKWVCSALRIHAHGSPHTCPYTADSTCPSASAFRALFHLLSRRILAGYELFWYPQQHSVYQDKYHAKEE